MVLQRDQPNKIWGKAEPSEVVSVAATGGAVAGVTSTITADAAGNWTLMLPKLAVGGPYLVSVKGTSVKGTQSKNEVVLSDILAG